VQRIRDFWTSCAFGCARAWHIPWNSKRPLRIFVSSFSEAKARSSPRSVDHKTAYFSYEIDC
jgi:hypothetical protein